MGTYGRVHCGLQLPCQMERQGQGGVVFVVLNGIDGLTGDPASFRQFLLGQAQGLPQGANPVFHGHPPSFRWYQARLQVKRMATVERVIRGLSRTV